MANRQNKRCQLRKWCEDCWARNFLRVQRVQLAAEQNHAGKRNRKGKNQATAKNEAKGRMDANSIWWVSDLLAADCKTAWLHPKWEDTMQWRNWLHVLKEDDERREEEHPKLVGRRCQMLCEVKASCTESRKPQRGEDVYRRWGDLEEDANRMRRCGPTVC